MGAAISAIGKAVFTVLTYEFDAGDITFSLWEVFMAFALCYAVGYVIYLLICALSGMGD